MKQFLQQNFFSNLSEDKSLNEEYVINIAMELSSSHQYAATSTYIESFGFNEAMKSVVSFYYDHKHKYIKTIQKQNLIDEMKAFIDDFFVRHSNLLIKRIAQGKIKECHRDLSLSNVCIFNEKAQIFNPIEFNEIFRNRDTFYDVVCFFINLCLHNQCKLGNLFLNSYLEYTGDYEGVLLLPLFACIDSYICAAVTSFLIEDPEIFESTDYENVKSTYDNYFKLAWKYSQVQNGKLFIMSGLSGSGKSTIARKLAQEVEGIHLRSDAIRKHLAGVKLMSRDKALYSPKMTEKTYSQLNSLGILLACEGFNVILDAKYDRVDLRANVTTLAETLKIPWSIVYCYADIEILRQRLIKRLSTQDDISGATPEMLENQQISYEPFTNVEHFRTVYVDTTQQLDIRRIINF